MLGLFDNRKVMGGLVAIYRDFGDTPQYPSITAANVVSGQDATTQAMQLAQQYFPQQMAAQGQGLNDIAQGQAYYNNFGPTSLSQALGNQYFSNIWPQEQAAINQSLSQSGMASSPVAAQTLGNAYGNLGVNVGEYLSNQSNQNATNNLQDLLSINPNSYYGPISSTITGQSNEQASLNQQASMQNAQAQYANSAAAYNQNQALAGTLGTLGGAAAGFAVGGPGGAMIGSSLGSSLGGSPSNLGQSIMGAQYLNSLPGQMPGSSTNGVGLSQGTGALSSAYNQASNGTQSVYGMPSGSQLFGNNPLQ